MTMKMTHHNAGFTLVEVLVAFFIFNLVLLGVGRGYLFVEHHMAQLDRQQQLLNLATELVQRGYRNSSTPYFEPHLWRNNESSSRAELTCDTGPHCTAEQLRGFDIQWFQSTVDALIGETNIRLSTCVSGTQRCLVIEAVDASLVVASEDMSAGVR